MKRFLLPILTGVAAVAAHAQESDSVRMYRLQQIEVTATRATPRTPVAYTDLSHDAIARNSYGTDIPTVLALTPSMIATNETGIGIGGTSIRLRGTDATRLNVTINGVAMNNPERSRPNFRAKPRSATDRTTPTSRPSASRRGCWAATGPSTHG